MRVDGKSIFSSDKVNLAYYVSGILIPNNNRVFVNID